MYFKQIPNEAYKTEKNYNNDENKLNKSLSFPMQPVLMRHDRLRSYGRGGQPPLSVN